MSSGQKGECKLFFLFISTLCEKCLICHSLLFLALSGAAAVWEAAIQADMKMWKSLAQESSKSVAGIPHEILNRCKKTVFVGACADLATASDERMHSVGFLTNPVVRERVSQSLGLNENMENLLMSSAHVACK